MIGKQGFSCFRSIIIWFEGKYTWLRLLITSWFSVRSECVWHAVSKILTQPEAHWCRYPMGEWECSGAGDYLIISWVKKVYGQEHNLKIGRHQLQCSPLGLDSDFCDSWRICLSSRQSSIIICFGKDNAESERKEGRECNRGTALHFFSSETKEQRWWKYYFCPFLVRMAKWCYDDFNGVLIKPKSFNYCLYTFFLYSWCYTLSAIPNE